MRIDSVLRSIAVFCASGVIVAGLGAAGTGTKPIGSVSSSGAFTLRGAPVNVDGVPSWPAMAGDEIGTGKDEAVVQLRGGARVVVLRDSRVKVDTGEKGILVRVLSGAVRVMALSPDLRIFLQDKSVNPVVGGVFPANSSQAQSAGDNSSVARSPSARAPKPISRR